MNGATHHDSAAIRAFFDGWHLYKRVIAHNYMFHAEILSAIGTWLDRHPNARSVLDLGCGDASVISRTLANTGVREYTGVDLSPVALQVAEQMLREAGIPASFKVADFMHHLQVSPNASVDVIVAGYTVHHLIGEGRTAFFRECRRVLKPEGGLLLYDVFMSGQETRDEYMIRNHEWRVETWSQMSDDDFAAIWNHVSTADYPQTIEAMTRNASEAEFAPPALLFEAPTGIHRLYAFS